MNESGTTPNHPFTEELDPEVTVLATESIEAIRGRIELNTAVQMALERLTLEEKIILVEARHAKETNAQS